MRLEGRGSAYHECLGLGFWRLGEDDRGSESGPSVVDDCRAFVLFLTSLMEECVF